MTVSGTDAVVVGSGPNGLAAAVILARAGLAVTVFEGESTIGGGARTQELTLPGFRHDVCSAVHPMAFASPFFAAFRLSERVPFVVPELSYGHPIDGERAAFAYRDIHRTAQQLGVDGAAWRRLLGPLAERADALAQVTSHEMLRVPKHPFVLAALGLGAMEQGFGSWNARFRGEHAPALLTGVMAHAIRPLPDFAAAAAGLVLAAHAHAAGWAIPLGGSQSIVDAMADDLIAHGGRIEVDTPITSLAQLPAARAVLLDTTPRSFLSMAGEAVPSRYASRLRRFRYGNAAAKVDFALSGPVPWKNEELSRAGTIHLGGPRTEVATAEREVAAGFVAAKPYVLVSQPSSFDPSRAPSGRHVLWSYTHVPRNSPVDPTEAVTARIEQFAPGFRDVILAAASRSAMEVELHDPNYVGGDISAGEVDFPQLLRRPTLLEPWRTPVPGVYLCSSSTPPGPGVHGLGGWNAARSALRREFGVTALPDLAPGA